jgi:hypothetical protein
MHMKLSQLFLLFALPCSLLYQPLALSQDDKLKLYVNRDLGIQIRYHDADDFENWKAIAAPKSQWETVVFPQYKISLKLPPGFSARTQITDESGYPPSCEGSPLGDSSIVISQISGHTDRPVAIVIYFTSLDFLNAAYHESFVLVDSAFDEVMLKDSVAIIRAIRANTWASLGGDVTKEEAIFLDGISWKGLHGSFFTRYSDEHGYAGLQRSSATFLFHVMDNKCNLVCSYSDSQMESNALREPDFYDIVSTIEIQR